MCLTIFLPIVLSNKVAKIRNRYNQVPHLTQDTNGKPFYNVKQQKREINPKKKDAIAWIVVIKYLKSSGDDLLLQTSFSDLGDHIF